MVCGWMGFVNIHHDYYQLMNIEVCVHVIMGTIKNVLSFGNNDLQAINSLG